MSNTARPRGPSDEGIHVEASISGDVWAGLSHRRLSVVDLSSTGSQSMKSNCGRFVIAFDGEIYNFQELRAGLIAQGKNDWRGSSDTEVLLELISRYGLRNTLCRLDGMYAFALIDRLERRLTLARDAFGEKPLVYGYWNGTLLFGSDIRALETWPGFAPSESAAAHAAIMQYSCIPAPLTIYRGVFKLRPAHFIEVNFEEAANSMLPEPACWWDMQSTALSNLGKQFSGCLNEAVDEVENVLSRSISRRLVAGAPSGTLLSGGIDSSLVTALVQRQSIAPVRSFTIGMQEDGYDESPYAAAVAQHLGTQHETLLLTQKEVLDTISQLPGVYDEPFADSSQVPTFLLSRMVSQHVSVALSGDGGDEFFAGYNRHFHGSKLWSRLSRIPAPLRSIAGQTLTAMPPELLATMIRAASAIRSRELSAERVVDKLHKLAKISRARDRVTFHDTLLQTGEASRILASGDPNASFGRQTLEGLQGEDFTVASMIFDTAHYLPDDVLTKVNRASMAFSLEVRSPFLSRELFELAWQLPISYRTTNGQGKRVLRELLYRHVPQQIIDRPKAGFAVPIGKWLRGPLSDWAKTHLSQDALSRSGIFNSDAVIRLWNEHQSGRRNHATFLWNVIMYQGWRDSKGS